MYFFIKLQFVCFLTLLLLIAELVLEHFTHSLTLLVVAWQTLYNFISLFISSVSIALSQNNSKELRLKVYNLGYQKLKYKNIMHKFNRRNYIPIKLTVLFIAEYIWVEKSKCRRLYVQPDISMCPLFWYNSGSSTNNHTQ